MVEQRLDFAPQFRISRAGFREECVALDRFAFQRCLVNLFDLSPAFGIHYNPGSLSHNIIAPMRQLHGRSSWALFAKGGANLSLFPASSCFLTVALWTRTSV